MALSFPKRSSAFQKFQLGSEWVVTVWVWISVCE